MSSEDVRTCQGGAADVAASASGLVGYACERGLIGPEDAAWAYNAVLETVGATGPGAPDAAAMLAVAYDAAPTSRLGAGAPGSGPSPSDNARLAAPGGFDLEATMARLSEAAVAAGVEEDTPSGRDRVETRVMGLFTPRPSEVAREFAGRYRQFGPLAATDWFYRMSCDTRYVREAAIARNVGWVTPTRWGDLEITINLSKPEKDPRAIAAAGAAKATGEVYPACQLCMENEGYGGRGAGAPHGAHPARQNLRIVPITLGGEHWGLQYSPYAYFSEHCIAMSAEHRLMHVDRGNMARLLDFVDLLPHYFVGSNADLPIVGGSILSHDHFQGGRHEFPMMRARVERAWELPGFPGVTCESLVWPLTVLRLRSAAREDLLDAADHVLAAWRAHSDPSVGVYAETDGVPHNTITPVARRRDDGTYELYLALRCNVTTEEHPLGVFHPHAEWHHIKKENIGLIEVMGLAILPPRLVGELGAVREHLLAHAGEGAGEALARELADDPLTASHADWALGLAAAHPDLGEENAEDVIRDGVGEVFGHVLEDAGVFKWDERGREALARFMARL